MVRLSDIEELEKRPEKEMRLFFVVYAAGRVTASVDVGTNGGSIWTRPSSVPSRSSTVLVTSYTYTYTTSGEVDAVTDPLGITSRTYYNALGRTVKTIEDYTDGVLANDQ